MKPVLWIHLVDTPVGSEKGIRAWTADAKRATMFEAEGIVMTPLYESQGWHSIDTAPKNRIIELFGAVDSGDRAAPPTIVQAIYLQPDETMPDGTWMVAFTDARPVIVENPTCWRDIGIRPTDMSEIRRALVMAQDFHQWDTKMYATIEQAITEVDLINRDRA